MRRHYLRRVKLAGDAGISVPQLCISFLMTECPIDYLIFGVDSLAQLSEIIHALRESRPLTKRYLVD